MYARSEYWNSLNPAQRSQHLIRGLSRKHPHWVFTGLSAVSILELEPPWALCSRNIVYRAVEYSSCIRHNGRLQYVYINELDVMQYGEIRITKPARAIVDCGLIYEFRQTLPIVDAALRRRIVSKNEILAVCDTMEKDTSSVLRSLHYADGRSENGGESLCRAIIIESGFAIPRLQEEFIDSRNRRYRVDFSWHLADGRIIVLEFVGTAKYVDSQMTNSHTTERVVFEERQRESALFAAGVTHLVRVNYLEVSNEVNLIRKLEDAGVPRIRFDL
jgi:hypothetical protein